MRWRSALVVVSPKPSPLSKTPRGPLTKDIEGEIMVVTRRIDRYGDPSYSKGDKVAQLLIRRRERIVWDQVGSLEDLGESERGNGGFGSTGK